MNKMFLPFFLAALVLCVAYAQAEATDWDFLGKNNLGTVYYDKYGIRQLAGNVASVKEARGAFPFIAGSETISYTIYTYELKCYAGSFRITRATTYNFSGEAIKGTALDYVKTGEASWDHITPNSLVSRLSERSCRYLLYGR
jgi:hypothetical protein